MMCAGLKGHISDRSSCRFAGSLQRIDLGMGFARFFVKSLANDLAIFGQDAANDRVRMGRIPASFSKTQRACHMNAIL